MQKLFSLFPTGAPGMALLLLRCTLALSMFLPIFDAHIAIRAVLAALLGSGLLTPIATLLACMLSVIALFHLGYNGSSAWVAPALLVVLSTCLTMLGPGAYSADSRLFGRRVVWPPDSASPQ